MAGMAPPGRGDQGGHQQAAGAGRGDAPAHPRADPPQEGRRARCCASTATSSPARTGRYFFLGFLKFETISKFKIGIPTNSVRGKRKETEKERKKERHTPIR